MRTILFAVALLIFTASTHAAGPAPHAVACNPNTAQIDGHKVTTKCAPYNHLIYQEWRKEDGKPDRADGPAIIVRNDQTGTVTYEVWYRDGKQIAPPRAAAQ